MVAGTESGGVAQMIQTGGREALPLEMLLVLSLVFDCPAQLPAERHYGNLLDPVAR